MYTCIQIDMAETDTPIDEMTDEELNDLAMDAALDWQQYCKYVLPDCSYYFFKHGCEEDEDHCSCPNCGCDA